MKQKLPKLIKALALGSMAGAALGLLMRYMDSLEGRIVMLEAQDRQQDEDIWDLQCAVAAATNDDL